MLYGGWVLTSDYLLYQHGQQLAREIEAEQLTDLDQIWTKWTELSKGNPSSFLLHGPRKVVKQKFVAAADHVIDTYRNNESQLVYEKEWERARTMAARALAVDPDDGMRGKLRLCEGHLARINGTSHRSAQEFNLAVEKFNEAAEAAAQIARPGTRPGARLRLRTEGYRQRLRCAAAGAEARLSRWAIAKNCCWPMAIAIAPTACGGIRAMCAACRRRRTRFRSAADDYKRAEELYQSISPWGKSIVNVARVRISLESVNFRLHQIESEPSLEYGRHPQQIG